MKIEIDPWRTPSREPRYCETCDEIVMDVWTDTHRRRCPACQNSPSLFELGTRQGDT